MTSTASLPPPVATAPAAVGYFQLALPGQLILTTFFVVTLPLVALSLLAPEAGLLIWIYVWLFGMTHFVVTLTIYLQSRNLRHFASSWRNRLLFFIVPVAVFVGFDLLHAFRVGATFPLFALWFWAAIRMLDFNHFNRQSFGVLQLFKGRTGVKYPIWVKKVENAFFCGLTGVLMVTFFSGGVFPLLQSGGWLSLAEMGPLSEPQVFSLDVLQSVAVGGVMICLGLFGIAIYGMVSTWAAAGRPAGLGQALGYFLIQSAAAVLAIISFPLYLAALAVHYVEYHVLMIPRCFHTPLDDGSRLDRAFGKLRSHRGLFYLAILVVAGLVTAGSLAGMGMMGRGPETLTRPFDYLLLIAVFDGLFVFHYFIEMLIWRFSDPFFRKSLTGLYFAPKAG